MSYTCTKVKLGRPKVSRNFLTCDRGTDELRCRREKLGLYSNHEPMTCLFILWSRKSITYEQFIAGCYYEELCYKLKKSSGFLQGTIKTSLARLQQSEINVIKHKMPVICINEQCSNILADIRALINILHPDCESLIDRIVILNDFDLLNKFNMPFNSEIKIVTKTLDVIFSHMQKYTPMQDLSFKLKQKCV